MCLIVDRNKTWSIRSPSGELRYQFYKVFVIKEDYLITPYFKFRVNGPGEIEMQGAENYGGQLFINKAFHARTTEESTKMDKFHAEFFEMGKTVVLPITVVYFDIIAFGLDDKVAFKSYKITEETWRKVWTKSNS